MRMYWTSAHALSALERVLLAVSPKVLASEASPGCFVVCHETFWLTLTIETSTSDTTFSYFQDSGNAAIGDCPIGIYTTYSQI